MKRPFLVFFGMLFGSMLIGMALTFVFAGSETEFVSTVILPGLGLPYFSVVMYHNVIRDSRSGEWKAVLTRMFREQRLFTAANIASVIATLSLIFHGSMGFVVTAYSVILLATLVSVLVLHHSILPEAEPEAVLAREVAKYKE